VNAILINPATPTNLYVGTDQGVYRSLNRGADWVEYSNGLTNLRTTDLAIRPGDPTVVYAGTYGIGVFTLQKLLITSFCDQSMEISNLPSPIVR
jgi:hypothetical protein